MIYPGLCFIFFKSKFRGLLISLLYIFILSNSNYPVTVSNKSEFTPHISANILVYFLKGQYKMHKWNLDIF